MCIKKSLRADCMYTHITYVVINSEIYSYTFIRKSKNKLQIESNSLLRLRMIVGENGETNVDF